MLVVRATTPILKGEEVFNDYGPLPRSDLARMYGYVTDRYTQYDVVEISLKMICETAKSMGKKYNSKSPKLETFEDGFAIQRPTRGQRLEHVLPIDLQSLISTLCQSRRVAGPDSSPAAGILGFPELELLSEVVSRRLKEYPTSAEQDEATLRQLEHDQHRALLPCGVLKCRHKMAVEIRKGEKEVFMEIQQLVLNQNGGAFQADGITSEINNKKRKQDSGGGEAQKVQKAI